MCVKNKRKLLAFHSKSQIQFKSRDTLFWVFWHSLLVFLLHDKFSRSETVSRECQAKEETNESLPWDSDYFSDKDYFYGDSDSNSSSQYPQDVGPWEMYHDIKPRCFSMCEPPELFFRELRSFPWNNKQQTNPDDVHKSKSIFWCVICTRHDLVNIVVDVLHVEILSQMKWTNGREDKLIKTVVVHNGNYPIRYYMFLFPDTPQFQTHLGDPLLLTPLLERGEVEQARQDVNTKLLKILKHQTP